jgi:MFS family permease
MEGIHMTLNFHPPRDVVRRNLLAAYVAAFFASLGFSFVTPLLPLFVLEILDGDLATVGFWVGIALGVSPLLTAITGPFWGSLSDRVGQKIMIQRALVAIGAAIGLMALIDHPWQLMGLRGIIGALGGISVATLAAVSVSSSKQTLGRNIGLLQAAQTLGMVAGPLLGGGLAVVAGMRPTFVISGVLFALGFGLVTWLYRDVPKAVRSATEPKAAREKPTGRLATSYAFWITLAVLFTGSFIDGSFMVILPLYLSTLGAPSDGLALVVGLGLSGGALAMALAAALSGRLTARFRTGTLLLALLGASAVVLLAIALATTWWQLIGLRVLLGLAAGGLPTLAYAAAADLVPASRRGAVVGIASSGALMGWAIAPLVVGFLIGIDPHAVFLVNLLLVAGCALALACSSATPDWRAMSGAAGRRFANFAR